MSGSSQPQALWIPAEIFVAVCEQARATFPHECCGWLMGPRDASFVTKIRPCHNAYDAASHPTAQDRTAETAYVIAGADLLELAKTLDDAQPPRVIYHSHPNGRAYFSDTDRRVARDPWGNGPMYPVQQLVIGIDSMRVVEAALFAWDDDARLFSEVARFAGMAV